MRPTSYGVVILSYNHPELTGHTIDSVLQVGQTSCDAIYLVHNGSEVKHVQALQNKYPQLTHLILPTNIGYSGGANYGLLHAFKEQSEILFLTNDTEALELPTSFPPNLDLFSVAILKRNTTLLDSLIGTVDLNKGQLRHLRSADELSDLKSYIKTYIPGTAFGIKKQAFEQLKGFDETLHTYWEDVDFSLRAHFDTNLRLGFNELFRVKHKIGKTCHKHRFYTLYLFQRNRKRILRKFGQSGFQFFWRYAKDMASLFFKILFSNGRRADLRLWWKAIYD